MKVSQLKKNPNNPRQIKGEKLELLKRSVGSFQKMMSLRPIVIDENNVVLGGNMRLAAIKALGLKEIPDEWVKKADDLTEEEKREFIAKDNIGFGEWDWDVLANEWDSAELTEWGLDLPDFAAIEEEEIKDAAPATDKAAEVNKKWKVKEGDLFRIGGHRLLCGDSTDKTAYRRCVGEEKPNLMVTDPPYGVEYDAEWREGHDLGVGERSKGKVLNDDRDDWTDAYRLFEGDVAYVWHASLRCVPVGLNLMESGFDLRYQIIWKKQHFALSRGHYHWQHEPCWYVVRKGSSAHWISEDRTQASVWEIANNNSFGNADREETWGHSTQKPLECMAKPIRNHEGDVYEPFAGSGTTLVAAENLGRKCYAIELNPDYCAVILERMATAFPGIEIERIEDAKGRENAEKGAR